MTVESWHIRKEVTLGTLLALLVYGVSFLIIVAKMDARVETLEKLAVPQERIAVAETLIRTNQQNIDRLEARTIRSLDEIKVILERIEKRQEALDR